MNRAIELAVENVNSGKGGPFASVIVKSGKIVGEGTNRVTSTNDPTAHAEVVAIRAACAALGAFQLDGCDLYTTCEPCPMCMGAIYWARPARIFFGATAADAAAAGFSDEFIYEQINVEYEKRQIPFVPMMREATLACFDAWRAKEDRVDY
ncbi:MAG: nucleoside deaminase [Bryobacteraceae bacterium]